MTESAVGVPHGGRTRPSRAAIATTVGLAVLAYLPALTAAPGRMPADSKLYLYLDPGRFIGDASASFDARQFAGWVPHQHIAYLWPSGPWYWLFETIGMPDWIAHRLWIGTLMFAAGMGARWCARVLGVAPLAAAVAAVVYQVSVYVLPYVSRTSVMLLPWAGLGWIVAFTVLATRRRGWGDPAAIALIVLTVGAVNATALAMIIPAPALWLVHARWQRLIGWKDTALVIARVAVLSVGVSLWWITMLVIQGRHGADVLPYSESLADVSLTATAPEVWRGLGYWLFYIRDPFHATTSASLRYLVSTPAIALAFLVPILCLAGITFVGWAHRRFAALLVATGGVLAVGVHPIDQRSPLMSMLAGDDQSGLALALRSSTRAMPVMTLGLALGAGALVMAVERLELRPRAAVAPAVIVVVLALANLPVLFTGGFVDPELERDQSPPTAWTDAADALDAGDPNARVLQVPGIEFGAYRWGYTVDQPLPGLTERALVTRDLLPLGSPAAMDLLYAFDDRIQDGVLEPSSIATVARLLGADSIWATNDIAFDRFRSARPEIVAGALEQADTIGEPTAFGDPTVNVPDISMVDAAQLGEPRVGRPAPPVQIFPVESADGVIRSAGTTAILSGSGDGVVDLAAAGLLDVGVAIRYSASIDDEQLDDDVDGATALLVTDSNRDRARHWRGSQDTTGFTETGGGDGDVLRPVASDQRLPVFDTDDASTQTVAEQRGPVTATATSYGEPFAYLPEHRPYMAIDGDVTTAWLVGEHGDPVGETIRLEFDAPVSSVSLRQPAHPGYRAITAVTVTSDGTDQLATLLDADGAIVDRTVTFPAASVVEVTIDEVDGGTPGTAGAVAGVGFHTIDAEVGPTTEVVVPPHDALSFVDEGTPLALAFTRLRVDPTNAWRSDPEPDMVRAFDLPVGRAFEPRVTARIDRAADDATLATFFGWPATASSRLAGSPRNAGVAAIDGDAGTSWITGFGEALGARLTIDDVTQPVDSVTITQPSGEFSPITAITLRAGDQLRHVELAGIGSRPTALSIDPPLPPGTIEIEISAIESRNTVDRRFGDTLELPAAIAEITLPGLAPATPVAEASATVECAGPLLAIDDEVLPVSISVVDPSWLDGAPIDAEVCVDHVAIGEGEHLVETTHDDLDLPVTVDRVVLDSGASEAMMAVAAAPEVEVLERSRFDRQVEVAPCPEGCWLILGEGYNDAWSAAIDGESLGMPVLIDGGFNGWWLAPSSSARTIDIHWTAQRTLTIALVVSLIAAVVALVLVVRGCLRRRGDEVSAVTTDAPVIVTSFAALSGTRSIVYCLVWAATAGLLIGPWWSLCGLLGGLVVIGTRRAGWGELTAWSCVAAIGLAVTYLERRDAPFPNGAWPVAFESLHGLGMFAFASLLAAALVTPGTWCRTPTVLVGADDRYPPAS